MNKFFFTIVSFFLLLSCSKSIKPEVFFVENANFFLVNPEYLQYRLVAEKEFRKMGYVISKIKVDKYDGLIEEIKKIFEVKKNVTLFVEPFIAPLLVNWSGKEIPENVFVISYGMNNSILNSKIPLFNISFEGDLINSKILESLQRNTNKNAMSMLLVEQSSTIKDFITINDAENKDNYHFITISSNTDSSIINVVMKDKPVKNIVLYAGINNRVVNAIEHSGLKSMQIIEVITNYGKLNSNIDLRIYPDYSNLIKEGLRSKEFKIIRNSVEKEAFFNYKSKNKEIFKKIKN